MVKLPLNALGFIVACLLLVPASIARDLAATIDINISAQPLSSALLEFSAQTKLQVMTQGVNVRGLSAPGIAGQMTVREALEKLLAGSGLTFKVIRDSTVGLIRAREGSASTLDVLQAEPDGSLAVVPEGNASSRASAEANSAQAESELEQYTPEILVRGSRLLNVDVRRTEDDPQPYVVFDRAQIDRAMSVNLEDFLKTRLPMNTVQGTTSQDALSAFGAQSSINLRGLGTNQTLILVDGRRMPSVSAGTAFNQPDINGIPLAAIERIEVLPSTASGIYGGGATGGVVNIITRKDYAGIDVSATYGNAFDMDVGSRRFDASGGFGLEGGRTRIVMTGSYADTDPLLVGERDFVERARALQMINNPSAFTTATQPPFGHTSNIRSQNGSNLVLDNGTPLNSPRTFVPPGYAGPASDGGAALVANAGQYNLDLPADLNGGTQSLLNSPTVKSGSLNIRRSFSERVDGFLDAAWLRNHGEFLAAIVPGGINLAASAPNNPFTTGITVRFPATGLSFPFESDTETRRATGGAIIRLPGNWTMAAEYVWSRAEFSWSQASPVVGDPDGPGPGTSANTAFSNGTLDVLRDVNASPLDYSPYLLPLPNLVFGPGINTLNDATLRVSGPLIRTRSGPITLSAFIERRDEEARDTFLDLMAANATTTATYFPARSQRVNSYYLEARAPLVADTTAMTLLRGLDVQASVRRDEYKTTVPNPSAPTVASRTGPFPDLARGTNEVQATEYTAGLRYSPVHDIALRASIGTGFLPPSVSQIVPNAGITTTTTLADPRRGGVSATTGPFRQVGAGNPNLLPEDSDSWSAGIIFTPRFLPEFRLSVDYTRIEKINEIRSLTAQQLLDLEDSYPGRVIRQPLLPEDAARGFTGGVISELDLTLLNVATSDLEAYDVQADYVIDTDRLGQFHLYVLGTWQPHLRRQAVLTAPVVDSVGFSSGQLEWRGNGGLTWEKGPWAFGWNTQYFDSYLSYAAGATAQAIAAAELNQGSDSIPSQTYHDAFVRYRFGDLSAFGLDGVEIRLGVQNVLNKTPPILATTGSTGGYSTYADPRLRRFSASISAHF